MIKLTSLFSLFLFALSLCNSVSAGVIIGGTRLVYDASKKEASIAIINQDKKPYLIQSWLENELETDSTKIPFIITPPLFRLNGDQENALRIVFKGMKMPEDRESMYWLNVKSIPSTEKTDSNELLISIKTQIKMFYRPAELAGNAAEAYKSLTVSQQGNHIIFTNPTPYYVSFYNIKVSGKEVENPGYISPKSSIKIPATLNNSGVIAWKSIGDFGNISEEMSSK